MSALLDAIDDEDLEIVRRLVREQPELLSLVEDDLTPLMRACQSSHEDLVQILLDAGADPNQFGDDRETALHVASFHDCEKCVRLLLQYRANAGAKTEEGKTPLMNAAQAGSIPIINMLLKSGADARDTDDHGRTAWHWAVVGEHDDAAIARVLLKAGVDPAAKSASGDTALEYARAMKKPNLEHYLASHTPTPQ